MHLPWTKLISFVTKTGFWLWLRTKAKKYNCKSSSCLSSENNFALTTMTFKPFLASSFRKVMLYHSKFSKLMKLLVRCHPNTILLCQKCLWRLLPRLRKSSTLNQWCQSKEHLSVRQIKRKQSLVNKLVPCNLKRLKLGASQIQDNIIWLISKNSQIRTQRPQLTVFSRKRGLKKPSPTKMSRLNS